MNYENYWLAVEEFFKHRDSLMLSERFGGHLG